MAFKAGVCVQLFVALAIFSVFANAEQSSDDQSGQKSSNKRFPRQIVFPGPSNYNLRRAQREDHGPKHGAKWGHEGYGHTGESGPDYGHTGHSGPDYGHGHEEHGHEYGHGHEEHGHEYGHGHGHEEHGHEYGHEKGHEYGHKHEEHGHEYGHEYGHEKGHEQEYGHEGHGHEYGHSGHESGYRKPNPSLNGHNKPGGSYGPGGLGQSAGISGQSGLVPNRRPGGGGFGQFNAGQTGPGFGQSAQAQIRPNPGLNGQNGNLGQSNFGQSGPNSGLNLGQGQQQPNFGQSGPNSGQLGQNPGQLGLNLEELGLVFGQSGLGMDQNRPNPTKSVLRRTTRQVQGADYDDMFIFDQTTRRPNGQRPTPRPIRPPQRPIVPTPRPVRPTQRPVNPIETSTDTQFPFVAQPVATDCTADCIRQYVTNEYNPVCGTDGITYTNPGKIQCAARCGKNVSAAFNGACPGLNVNAI